MKNKKRVSIVLLLCLVLSFSIAGCGSSDSANTSEQTSQIWTDAVYTEDTELGEGSTTVNVEVKAEDQSITFAVHTDQTILGDALTDCGLIGGEEGDYGLYVTVVNGITADYDTDKAYWAFYKDGEYMNTGVDATTISDGEHYELVYTQD